MTSHVTLQLGKTTDGYRQLLGKEIGAHKSCKQCLHDPQNMISNIKQIIMGLCLMVVLPLFGMLGTFLLSGWGARSKSAPGAAGCGSLF
jgi:hypothetical protein